MRILDRYILKSVLSIFFSCLLSFLFLYVIIDVFSHLDEILKQQVGLKILLEYYLSFLPIIFVQVTPIACLLSTLYTFGKLNRDNEIIAMRSSGLSIFQISKTMIMVGLIASIFVFWVNDRFVPASLSLTEKIKAEMENKRTPHKPEKNEVINNLCMYGSGNRLYFINKFSVSTNTMQRIIILEHDKHQNIIKKIVANKGIFSDGLWKFYQCITYNFDENAQIKEEPRYLDEETMSIPETPQEFLAQRQRADYMTIAQIENYIWKLSKSGAATVINNFKVDLYQRFALPLTSIIIILLGIPFSLMIKKRATGFSSFGIALMVGFLYYGLNAVCIALGKKGILAPMLAASLSHIVALLSSLYLIGTLP